jgi:hypothetical protein
MRLNAWHHPGSAVVTLRSPAPRYRAPPPQYIACPVGTLAVGQAASMASLLLAAGAPGQRRTLPHRRVRAGVCKCWGRQPGQRC